MYNIGDIVTVAGHKFEIDGYRDSVGNEPTIRRYTAKMVANTAIRSEMPELSHFIAGVNESRIRDALEERRAARETGL